MREAGKTLQRWEREISCGWCGVYVLSSLEAKGTTKLVGRGLCGPCSPSSVLTGCLLSSLQEPSTGGWWKVSEGLLEEAGAAPCPGEELDTGPRE